MKITSIQYNWSFASGAGEGEDYYIEEIGKKGVIKIKEHLPQGEGDRLYYDIIYKDKVQRVFNPNVVTYIKEEQDGE